MSQAILCIGPVEKVVEFTKAFGPNGDTMYLMKQRGKRLTYGWEILDGGFSSEQLAPSLPCTGTERTAQGGNAIINFSAQELDLISN